MSKYSPEGSVYKDVGPRYTTM